jgi:uncharacterized phage protein (TIGR01671 family)
MKREILFRGAIVGDGHFVNGSLVEVNGECDSNESLPHIVISYGPDTFDWFEVEPETVGQFTGMTDKHGTKIFEGDILNEPSAYKDDIYQVFWDECRFSFCAKNGYGEYYLDEMCQSICEVIGNIHDNKELLK